MSTEMNPTPVSSEALMPPRRKMTVWSNHFSVEIDDGLISLDVKSRKEDQTQLGTMLAYDDGIKSCYVDDYVQELFHKDLSSPLSNEERLKVEENLKGILVETYHLGYIRRYRIVGVSTEPTDEIMFALDDESGASATPSVFEYFHQKYKIALKYPKLPAIRVASSSKTTYFPMEVLKIVDGQRYDKNLNVRQVSELLKNTCHRPSVKEKRITELKFHESGQQKTIIPNVGQWDLIDKKMFSGGEVDNWTCINFSHLKMTDVDKFIATLTRVCLRKGITFKAKPLVEIRTSGSDQIEKSLKSLHHDACATGKDLQLLIVILPNVTASSYDIIKRVCEMELGIVSQCCQPNKALICNMQYMDYLSLKISVKVGGRNSVLKEFHAGEIAAMNLPTIIFGADVYHPQAGDDSSPSIAAVVASIDWPKVTKYRGLVSAQAHGEEIIQNLNGMIRDHILDFYKANGVRPSKIIFYRDGVGNRQFSQVLMHEMNAIREACASIQKDYLPRVTFVVVLKRHHTRPFPAKHGDLQTSERRSGNILPGTVVDTEICHPHEFDFHLCNNAGLQGTGRPARYHVLFDENNITADDLQLLTYYLCYTYARCTRSVSIVAPVYYARIAAFRARLLVESSTNPGAAAGGGGVTRDTRAEV